MGVRYFALVMGKLNNTKNWYCINKIPGVTIPDHTVHKILQLFCGRTLEVGRYGLEAHNNAISRTIWMIVVKA